MFIINPTISLVAVAVVVVFYGVLTKRRMDAPFEDIRSGLFVAFSEWAAKKASSMPSMQQRAWKPNLLIPIEDIRKLRGSFSMIEHITYPKGSAKLLGIGNQSPAFSDQLRRISLAFRERGVFSSFMVIEQASYSEGLITGMQVLQGAFFRPNILFLSVPNGSEREEAYRLVVQHATSLGLGALVYAPHPESGLGQRQYINVWIRDRSPDWQLRWDIGYLDLAILSAYKLMRNWRAEMRLITVIQAEADRAGATRFMSRLVDLARIPDTQVVVAIGDFVDYVKKSPLADLSVFGLVPSPDFAFMRRMVGATHSTCLFVRDSGSENVLA